MLIIFLGKQLKWLDEINQCGRPASSTWPHSLMLFFLRGLSSNVRWCHHDPRVVQCHQKKQSCSLQNLFTPLLSVKIFLSCNCTPQACQALLNFQKNINNFDSVWQLLLLRECLLSFYIGHGDEGERYYHKINILKQFFFPKMNF